MLVCGTILFSSLYRIFRYPRPLMFAWTGIDVFSTWMLDGFQDLIKIRNVTNSWVYTLLQMKHWSDGTAKPTGSIQLDHIGERSPGQSVVIKPSVIFSRPYPEGLRVNQRTGSGHLSPSEQHMQGSPQPRLTKPQKSREPSNRTGGPFYCGKCQKSFNSRGGLRYHMQQHTGRFTYWCDRCQRGFSVQCNYQAHMAKHEGRTFPCDLCEKRFSCKRSLQRHYVEHRGDLEAALGLT